MKVRKTKKGITYREKIYVDGKEITSPRFDRKSDAKDCNLHQDSSDEQKLCLHELAFHTA